MMTIETTNKEAARFYLYRIMRDMQTLEDEVTIHGMDLIKVTLKRSVAEVFLESIQEIRNDLDALEEAIHTMTKKRK